MARSARQSMRQFVVAAAALVVAALLLPFAAPGTDPAAEASPRSDTTRVPFLCTTEFNGLGQPIVDNQDKRGTPVYPTGADGQPDRSQPPLGWSERCQAPDLVEYRYRTTGGSLQTLAPGTTELPADVAMLDVGGLVGADAMEFGGAAQIPYVLRFERGTLPEHRFLYSIAMLVPFDEVTTGERSTAHWNRRLLFSFGGGVGIGHSQGDLSTGAATMDEAMRLGHAVIYTSGNRTSVHYNLMLGGRTAVEAKDLFSDRYGAPRFTIGIGGSGGGIQQYVYAQNHPGLLDAAVPQYSYPDMSTQTIHIGDCELLAHYMDVLDADNARWQDWDNRRLLLGLNSIQGFTSSWQARTGAPGSTECIEGWRGSTPLAMNPTFGLATRMDSVILPYAAEMLTKLNAGQPPVPDDFPDLGRLLRVAPDGGTWVEWTHWDDVREVYGTDPDTGFARVPWDNVGVQYGLRYVADGTLTPDEFLGLNAQVGSWKEPEDTVLESCGLVGAMVGTDLAMFAQLIGMCEGAELDEHSARQMQFSADPAHPAPRRQGDVDAIRAAYDSGLVFTGRLPREIPIIDARHYLEHQLDMHNVQQSFGARQRLERAGMNPDNHLIWFLDARPTIDQAATFQLHVDAFRLLDEWLLAIDADPARSVAANRPASAVDRCWTTDGTLVAEGSEVWHGAEELVTSGAGAWTGSAPETVAGESVGPCAAHFPLYSTSRIVAGGPIEGDVYKCRTMSVEAAIDEGIYGEWTPTPAERAQLQTIFPDGVCDYSRVGVGSPFNAAPVASSTSAETTVGTPVTVNLDATDPDGDPLTYRLLDPPTAGTVDGVAPELTFTPNPGFEGTDSFTWQADDGDLRSAVASVSITVSTPVPETTTTTAPQPTTTTTVASTTTTTAVAGGVSEPTTTTRPATSGAGRPPWQSPTATGPGMRAGFPGQTTSRPGTPGRRGILPRTGAEAAALAAVGVLAIGGGFALLRVRRRTE
ncbi:MAG: cadherin-like domain-containing protein [Acidimicrobiia bacterium]|nr:cadherin-like domain-containing protein [Acidimicrobiia bacterium]